MLMAAVAVLSMTLGTLAAITQNNIKRLLAYSSITQVGYILLGFVASVNRDGSLNPRGLQAMAFYLLVYAFFNTGAFAVVILLRHKGVIGDDIDDLNGLIQRNPGAAILMLIFLLSLAGIPPTAGFVAKLLVFWALIETGHYVLAILSVAYILPAVYYYFRMVAAMWVKRINRPRDSQSFPGRRNLPSPRWSSSLSPRECSPNNFCSSPNIRSSFPSPADPGGHTWPLNLHRRASPPAGNVSKWPWRWSSRSS